MTLNDLADMGIHISLVGEDKIRASVPSHINTPELKQEIVAHKPRLIEELKARSKMDISELADHVMQKIRANEKGDAVLERWRKDSIPRWQEILQESIDQGTNGRKEYAEWMLKEVLGAYDN